jgi:hypothetical protein
VDWREVKRLAILSGNWIGDGDAYGGTWVFPDGTELMKNEDVEIDLHHGMIARDVGLTGEALDPYYGDYMSEDDDYSDESNDRYWQAVNSLCKQFGMVRKSSGIYQFQVWDSKAFAAVKKNLELTGKLDRHIIVDVTSNRTRYDGCLLDKGSVSKLRRRKGRKFYARGLHPHLEEIFAGTRTAPYLPENWPICRDLALSALI